MTEPEEGRPLKDLEARLKAARGRQARDAARQRGEGASKTGVGLGFKLALELVTGIVVGVGLGFLLDKWLGTEPLFLILLFFLGAAAGILNVYRAASGQGYAVGFQKPDQRRQDDGDTGANSET